MSDVFLHVGLYKTGTTTIQAALGARADDLAARGVLFPGGHRAQRLAAYDLLGQRVGGERRGEAAGALGRLVALVDAHDGPAVVVSEEELSLARPRQARRLVRALDGHRVFVVVGARDMARTLVSSWQQTIVNGGSCTWADFVASVRGEDGAAPSEGVSFHWRHDLLRVIDTWAAVVPPERVRVVTVPPRGAPSTLLLDRFAEAACLPAGWSDGWPGEQRALRNVSLGAAELEVVRRLNAAVAGRLNTAQHRFVIEAGIRSRLAGSTDRPLELPARHLGWARQHGERLVAELEHRGTTVHGDLADLVPSGPAPTGRDLDEHDDAELLAATRAALESLALDHGRLFKRYRAAFVEAEGRLPDAAEVLASEVRAGAFWLRKRALHHADRHPALARASWAYLRRTSPSWRLGADRVDS
ncbi:hypothetical protein F4692_002484 [Nocardioides cavernae]|uniref:Sulfotransferase family protein n=1 Tax=Nocardioides cavernae TaxID=1921566 RepID=A0A7Y9H483_9ACTN|nr:hypothetical protein [Nocardioides cavernae]NYE37351.1 hypothetical protein [Nocardioides cavernae]